MQKIICADGPEYSLKEALSFIVEQREINGPKSFGGALKLGGCIRIVRKEGLEALLTDHEKNFSVKISSGVHGNAVIEF